MRETDINFPLVSDMNIAEDNIGIPQSLGASLVEGYPIPTAVILDKNKYVRWTESTDFEDVGSVEETLRRVRALKMVDEGKGMMVTPADWTPFEPLIRNTMDGVKEYYANKYSKEDDTDEKVDQR